MRPPWPDDTVFRRLVLDVEQDRCLECGKPLHVCDHRFHRFHTLQGPVELVARLAHCSDRACPERSHTLSPEAELSLTLPWCLIGWDVFCWLGHRRFKRHWSVPQIQAELQEAYRIPLSKDALNSYLHRYQIIVAARQQDPQQMAQAYRRIKSLVLTIDGLQPEKGHETLYVVREINAKRVWFGEALLSSNQDEVRRLVVRAREWAEALKLPVRLWLSDKQDAFVKGIAAEFPDVAHRYCANHFLRDLAKPTLEKDSHAKVQMRKRVRGLRDIEREVVSARRQARSEVETPLDNGRGWPSHPHDDVGARCAEGVSAGLPAPGDIQAAEAAPTPPKAAVLVGSSGSGPEPGKEQGTPTQATKAAADKDGPIVLAYCAAVRGILNDDQGGPLTPPGLRMAEGLREVQASLQRNLALNKPGPAHGQMERLAGCIESGLACVEEEQEEVRQQVEEIAKVAATLEEKAGSRQERRDRYKKLQQEYEGKGGTFYGQLGRVMLSWLVGLFVGPRAKKQEKGLTDNLDLERWFRKPKGHERRIHGRRHAGVRIVQEGATLVLVLDAHDNCPGPFTVEELLPYRLAEEPPEQQEALQRRKFMRRARSKKNEAPSSRS